MLRNFERLVRPLTLCAGDAVARLEVVIDRAALGEDPGSLLRTLECELELADLQLVHWREFRGRLLGRCGSIKEKRRVKSVRKDIRKLIKDLRREQSLGGPEG